MKGFQRIGPGQYRNAQGQMRTPQSGMMPGRRMGQQPMQMPTQPTPRPMAPGMQQLQPQPRPGMMPQQQGFNSPQDYQAFQNARQNAGNSFGYGQMQGQMQPKIGAPSLEQQRMMQQGAGPNGQPFDARTMSPEQMQQWETQQGTRSFGAPKQWQAPAGMQGRLPQGILSKPPVY